MTQHAVDLSAGPIRIREEGPPGAPPVVLVHGALVAGSLWDPVTERLAADHRVVVPDLPLGAHRVAMRPDADLTPPGLAAIIADLLDALELEDATVVANDTGGALTQLVMTSRPERIGRVVLVSCDAFENFPPKVFRPAVKVLAHVPGALSGLRWSVRSTAIQRSPLAFGLLAKQGLPPEVVREWGDALADPGVRRDTRKLMAGVDTRYTVEAARELPAFTKPVLMAWATEDRFFPIADAHRLAALLPESRVEPIADSFTFVMRDQPDRLAELVRAFVAEARVAA